MAHKKSTDFLLYDKEENIMVPIELIETDRLTYIKEMEDYLCKLKKLPKNTAKKIAKENLVKSQIIQENGEFSERYKFSRINSQKSR